jgi:DNA-binding XRE family transcriptional regulator
LPPKQLPLKWRLRLFFGLNRHQNDSMENLVGLNHFLLATAPEIAQQLGQRLRAQRLAQALTLEELAERAGVAVGTVRKLERDGNCTLLSWVRVLKVLRLEVELEPLFVPRSASSIDALLRASSSAVRQRAPKRRKP